MIDGLSLDHLLHLNRLNIHAYWLLYLWMFLFDPQCFCVNLDFENYMRIVYVLLFNSINIIQPINYVRC